MHAIHLYKLSIDLESCWLLGILNRTAHAVCILTDQSLCARSLNILPYALMIFGGLFILWTAAWKWLL